MQLDRKSKRRAGESGLTLVEVMVAMAIFGVSILSLYAGISFGFAVVKSTREDLRATQIILEKMETIRLYSWDQINTTNFIPTTFTDYYFPEGYGSTNGLSAGIVYNGQMTIGPGPSGFGYTTNMRTVTVDIRWNSDGIDRAKTLSTYVSRDGLQNYVY